MNESSDLYSIFTFLYMLSGIGVPHDKLSLYEVRDRGEVRASPPTKAMNYRSVLQLEAISRLELMPR